jgi:leader peptidase (prepilin peptidase)/N-methyltransferase
MSDEGADADVFARRPAEPLEIVSTAFLALAAVAASLHVAPRWVGFVGAMLASVMLAIAVVDWRRFIIPDGLTLLATVLGVVAIAVENSPFDLAGAMMDAAVRASAMAALFLLFRLAYRWVRGREGMGLGDVKLAGVAGLWLQWPTLPIAIEMAALFGLAVAMVGRARSRHAIDRSTKLPFGAFLAPAIWMCWLLERWPG